MAKKWKVCFNCLRQGHFPSSCQSKFRCQICSGKHHTLIHETNTHQSVHKSTNSINNSNPILGNTGVSSADQPPEVVQSNVNNISSSSSSQFIVTVSSKQTVLLATAQVVIESPNGNKVSARALLDTGADTSLISEWIVQSLQLKRNHVNISLSGIHDNLTTKAHYSTSFNLRSSINANFHCSINAVVVNKFRSLLPSTPTSINHWPHVQGLTLADKNYAQPSRIDLILGANIVGSLLLPDRKMGPVGSLNAHNTPFGWVLMGSVSVVSYLPVRSNKTLRCCTSSEHCSCSDLKRFWEIESDDHSETSTPIEEECENQFNQTHQRDCSGRYIVRLPLIQNKLTSIGSSREIALKLLIASERRMEKNPLICSKYKEFMSEYESLGHMQRVDPLTIPSLHYYLPHHAVFREHDHDKKVRVVFNASQATTSGVSLNQIMHVGPKLQNDLWLILTRWRLFRFVFVTDIIKMYRQILVHDDDSNFLLVLWRNSPSEAIQTFKLRTVTYGTSSAPYLAIRVLKQLAIDEKSRYPLGSIVLEKNTYVDDSLGGGDTIEETVEIKNQLINILKSGGFPTAKWSSNSELICLKGDTVKRQFSDVEGMSTLDVFWTPDSDSFSVKVYASPNLKTCISKRIILSEASKIFDPLGWCAPVIISVKILIQDLWILGVGWDENLSSKILQRWIQFKNHVSSLEQLRIPRWTYFSKSSSNIQIHGFCDASSRAYAVVIFMRVCDNDGNNHVSLLLSKTRVAPVKTQSIPRLQLCAAVLLANLLNKVLIGLELNNVTVYAWSHSVVVLHWIQAHSSC